MVLKDKLAKEKSAVIKKWFDAVVETYPPDTAVMLKRRTDPFENPVGSTTRKGLEDLFDQLTGAMDPAAIRAAVDPIIRIRAVQSFTPSRATGFVFALKPILAGVLEGETRGGQAQNALMRLYDDVDRIALIAFDIYMTCREAIYELKANEVKKSTFNAFKRAGLLVEQPDGPEFDTPRKKE